MSLRTAELDAAIVEGLTNGIPLRELCRVHGVSKSTVYNWIEADSELAGRIARARELGFNEIAESCLEIADDATNDWMLRRQESEDGHESFNTSFNSEHVQRSKLRIETRLKLLAKWDPKRYGDKLSSTVDMNITNVRELSDDQLAAIAAGSG